MINKCVNFDSNDSVSKYFKDVRKSVLVTQEEEIELAKKIKNGDQKAVDKLVSANLKFVISVAKDYQNQGLPLSDLINEGNYGLIKAANKFDHTKGFRFITYAVWWIKQSIIQSLNENARLVRLPVKIIHRLSKLKEEIEKFEFKNERSPVYGEVLDSNRDMMELLGSSRYTSLNEPINEDGDEYLDLMSESEDENKLIINDSIRDELNNTLSVLDERERDIIQCYFGFNTECEPMTLEDIGDKYSLSKERVRQIKEKTLRKIRHNAHKLYSLMTE